MPNYDAPSVSLIVGSQMSTDKNAEPFRMVISDVFAVQIHGTAVNGRVDTGTLRKGDAVQISGMGKPTILTTVKGFWGFIHDADNFVAHAGDNCLFLLNDVQFEQVERGMIVTSPNQSK
jgi:elongation factor Tu